MPSLAFIASFWLTDLLQFIDPENGVCGIASPQMCMPTDVPLAMQLKAAFRKHLGSALKEMGKST